MDNYEYDAITGRKRSLLSVLNQKKVSKAEMDDLFLDVDMED